MFLFPVFLFLGFCKENSKNMKRKQEIKIESPFVSCFIFYFDSLFSSQNFENKEIRNSNKKWK